MARHRCPPSCLPEPPYPLRPNRINATPPNTTAVDATFIRLNRSFSANTPIRSAKSIETTATINGALAPRQRIDLHEIAGAVGPQQKELVADM